MKIIIGTDAQQEFVPALRFIKSLNFDRPQVTLVHASSPVLPLVPFGYSAAAVAQTEYATVVENIGRSALEDAKSLACSMDINVKMRLLMGSPADVLCRAADEEGVDLVAVNATHHGRWSSTFLGSVSRSLAIGCQKSALITKGQAPAQEDLTAVFAIDHSDYSLQCFEKFLHMRTRGIKKVHIVTAFDMHEAQAAAITANLPAIGDDVLSWINEKLLTKNAELVEKLKEWGFEADARVVNGPTNDILRQAMQDTQSDLMIMGAQGSGFIQRMLIGSVSLHQIVAEPYPVLLIRA